MFRFQRHETQEVKTAIARTRAVGEHADRLNAILKPYLAADDPFKAFAVDVFERGQEARLHKGPPQ